MGRHLFNFSDSKNRAPSPKNIHSGTKRRQTIANNTALKSAEQKPGILTTLLLHHTRNAPMSTANPPREIKSSSLS